MARGAEERFVCDGMLGTLAKWLRILGMDTLFLRDAADEELLRIAREEGRVLLTCDRPLAARARKVARARRVEGRRLEEQLQEVVRAFGLRPRARRFSRCTGCNVRLERLDAETARARVPAYVARTQERFLRCPGCDRVYWSATHVAAMRRRLEVFLGGGPSRS